MSITILIADDDDSLRKLLEDIIKKQGYQCLAAENGDDALAQFYENPQINMAILDVMMPGSNGYEVLEEIRNTSTIPVLMLTALDDELNEIKGLTQGANDYIAKPFSYPVLVARIEALLRPIKQKFNHNIEVDILELHRDTHKVYVKNEEVYLNHKEYQLLDYLMSHHGQVLERLQILDYVWGYDYQGDDRTLNTHIKTLRCKLGDAGRIIRTVKGTGYTIDIETTER